MNGVIVPISLSNMLSHSSSRSVPEIGPKLSNIEIKRFSCIQQILEEKNQERGGLFSGPIRTVAFKVI